MIAGTPSPHLKQMVWDAMMKKQKLDGDYFSHSGQQLFARIDQIVFENSRMIVRSRGQDLMYWDLPRWSEGSTLTICLSPRSCIEVDVAHR
jgi:hypothetical protein